VSWLSTEKINLTQQKQVTQKPDDKNTKKPINNNTTTTTTVLRSFVRDYPGEPVPEETLTHPPS